MPTIGVIPRMLFEGPRMESDRLYRTMVGRSLSDAEQRAWIRLEKWVRSEKWSRSTAWPSCSWESDTCYTRNHFTANPASVNVPCFREILRNGPARRFLYRRLCAACIYVAARNFRCNRSNFTRAKNTGTRENGVNHFYYRICFVVQEDEPQDSKNTDLKFKPV